jgi:hypothetical protein
VTCPTSYALDNGGFPGVKEPDHEADHIPTSSAKLRMHGAVTLPHVLMAYCFVKHRDNFTFYLSLPRSTKWSVP